MNVFKIVYGVLDELYANMPGTDPEKDAEITKAILYLREQYGNLSQKSEINYSSEHRRFAYLYMYVTSHSNLIYEVLSRNSEYLGELFETDLLKIACLGGGPGSDLIGVLKYCQLNDIDTKIKFYLLDKETAWMESWSDIDEKLEVGASVNAFVNQIDVTNPSSWEKLRKYTQVDLIVFSYFLSEIFSIKEQGEAFFRHLFGNMKSGSRLIYIDNDSTEFTKYFRELMENNGLDVVAGSEGKITPPTDEEKRDLGRFLEKFGPPKLAANVAWRVALKR
jgi:hypothetical protein